MPNYDYKCDLCDETFEIFQKMSDDKLTDCPQAQCKGTIKRLLGGGAGIIFKGSGFYQTDYRSESYKKGESSEKSNNKPDKPKESSSN